MSERTSIDRSVAPATVASLQRDLRALGVEPGAPLIVHSSLSALGWVCGGAVAVVEALEQAVGGGTTLVMPAQSSGLSEPSRWVAPPVPAQWWPTIRQHLPAFDAGRTPTRGMGAIAEAFRTHPGVLRSHHPTGSFTARGPLARQVVERQVLEDPFGEASPLACLHHQDARILLLGVGYDSCTSLHLAERRAFGARQRTESTGCPVVVEGRRTWVEFRTPEVDSEDFVPIGRSFEAETRDCRLGRVGVGAARLLSMRALVAHAIPWMRRHRAEDGAVLSLP